jgi:beta-glucosidase
LLTSRLLKNDDGVLPFKDELRRIGVFGTDADYPSTLSGCGGDLFCFEGTHRVHWNGTVTVGGGSGAAYATYVVPPIEAISMRGRAQRMRVDHVLQNSKEHYPAIARVAGSVEMCLVAVSVFLTEGLDRVGLRLDNGGEKLIRHVADSCAGAVVVVIHAGGQVVMEDWIKHPKVKAVIFAGYPGQESGNALANILWGDVNPSGRLAFTLGKREGDWPKNNILRKPVSSAQACAASPWQRRSRSHYRATRCAATTRNALRSTTSGLTRTASSRASSSALG